MKIGIPRALLYFKNEKLWTSFLDEIGVEYIISPPTTKETIEIGSKYAVDEQCLPVKIFLGSVFYLLDKCDYIFLPRIEGVGSGDMCINFKAQYDLVKNAFRDYDPKILFYNVTWSKRHKEFKAFKKMGKFLGIKKSLTKYAYFVAKQKQINFENLRTHEQEKLLESPKNKILIVSHAYCVEDEYIGSQVTRCLKNLDCESIFAEYADEKECINASKKLATTMPWAYNMHLLGAIELLKDKVDGIIILTTFPCGPDSMMNEMILHKIKDKPILLLTLDAQDASAGIETRIESFVDIINFKKEEK